MSLAKKKSNQLSTWKARMVLAASRTSQLCVGKQLENIERISKNSGGVIALGGMPSAGKTGHAS